MGIWGLPGTNCGTLCVQEVNLQIKQSIKQLRILAAVAPFAAVSGSADTFFIVTKAVASFIKVRRAVAACRSGNPTAITISF